MSHARAVKTALHAIVQPTARHCCLTMSRYAQHARIDLAHGGERQREAAASRTPRSKAIMASTVSANAVSWKLPI